MQRLGRNQDGYRGEPLDVENTLAECAAAAGAHGWERDLLAPDALGRVAFRRRTRSAGAPRIYISTGIHGDEPAGPLTARRLLEEDRWPDADLWLLPCLNPGGFLAGTRTNPDGIDLNRDYRHFRGGETRGHIAWLERQPGFDLTLLLHEDWESHGFYTYEVNRGARPSVAPDMIAAVRPVCPIDESPLIDGREASEPGIIRPVLTPEERPEWPEALWLITHKTSLSYTLEAPSDWPLKIRVNALTSAVRAAVNTFTAG
ncbi:MAG: M14 family metallocarboxypeptidase [Verrucomicrobiales bacterium]|nr:M14 family metallocarboxypeptidase [Verrucomicrobiales bacterium]